MSKSKLLRKCPHCKSNKGFVIRFRVFGHREEIRDFKGNVLESDVADYAEVCEPDPWVECVSCKHTIDSYLVDIY